MYKVIKPFRAGTTEAEKIPVDAIYLFTKEKQYRDRDGKIFTSEFYLYYEMPKYWKETVDK